MKTDYPKAPRRPESWQCGKHAVQDAYLYMQNAKDPQVLSWVAEENAYTDRWFQDKNLEKRIAFLKNKDKKPSYSGISEKNGLLYASCRGTDGKTSAVLLDEHFHQRKVLLDRSRMDDRMQIFGVQPCPAQENLAAFSALKDGAARLSVLVRDLENDETLVEMDGTFSFTWSSDGEYVYSSTADQREDETTANSVIRWSRRTGKTETVYTWPGHAAFLLLSAAPNGEIFVRVCKDYHDTVLLSLNPLGQAVRVIPEEDSQKDYMGSIGRRHFFRTDDQAPLGKVICVEESPEGVFSVAKTIVSEGAFPLQGACVAGEQLLLFPLEDAVCRLKLYSSEGEFQREIQLPDSMGTVSLAQGDTWGKSALYLSFESFTCPPSILKYDIPSGQLRFVYGEEKTAEDLTVEQKFITARDGQRILAFLVYKKGLEKNGKQPALLYGYGGYGASQLPWYTNPYVGLDIPDWAQRGGLYVHCILRGGEEYGARWHEAGCGRNKKNVFYDFIDIAKEIVADGWTTAEHMAICGGSNGGLLTTALLTMEPSLWKCVIAAVPHTDMLHFSCDDRGPMYVTEYGDPRTEEFFDYMKSYSPYHNIREGVKYPFVYVQTGEQDNNVPPYHGKKFAAALQQATTGGPVLLRVLPYGSHDVGSGEYFYRTTAEMQTFIEYALGMGR